MTKIFRWTGVAALLPLALLPAITGAGPATGSPSAVPAAARAVRVQTLVGGLTIPWDLAFLPDRAMIFTERGGTTRIRTTSGTVRTLRMDQGYLRVAGEVGLLGITVDPHFASNRRFYTCQTYRGNATVAADVRVVRWRLSADRTAAARDGSPVVDGIPVSTFHGGCRLRFGPSGRIYVGTGDAGVGTAPQNLNSLAGKVLRVEASGAIPSTNPYRDRPGDARYVWSYGHRNVQGIAIKPGTSQVWTAEHGPDRDDEVNIDQYAGNYGWNPVPGYDQSVPMTDRAEFPSAKVAAWSSGSPTRATSGITFITGAAWGSLQGQLAVGLLKDSGVMLLRLDASGRVVGRSDLPQLAGTYGRIRTVQMGPDGALYVTTSNGGGTDRILRVTPS